MQSTKPPCLTSRSVTVPRTAHGLQWPGSRFLKRSSYDLSAAIALWNGTLFWPGTQGMYVNVLQSHPFQFVYFSFFNIFQFSSNRVCVLFHSLLHSLLHRPPATGPRIVWSWPLLPKMLVSSSSWFSSPSALSVSKAGIGRNRMSSNGWLDYMSGAGVCLSSPTLSLIIKTSFRVRIIPSRDVCWGVVSVSIEAC